MRCPFCGAENIAGSELCEHCGSELAGLDIPEAHPGPMGRLMRDRIGDIDFTPPITATAEETVAAVVRRMREARHGCVQIMDGDEQTGLFTERHLMSRVLGPGRDPAATAVGEVMIRRPTTSSVDDPPAFAIHRMVAQGFRHLPITRDGRLEGSISVRNILSYVDREILGADPAR